MGLLHAAVVHRALPSGEQDVCVWQAEASGKGGQEEVAFAFPHHLPTSIIPPSGRAMWAALCAQGEMLLKKLQPCALPSLSPLYVLAPDREAPDFSAAPFQYWHRVKKLA